VVKHLIFISLSLFLFACGRSEGVAPSSEVTISVSPDNIIVPKSITTSLQVTGLDTLRGTLDLTSAAACTSDNPIVTITNGQVSNNYTGTSVVRLNITCTYDEQSVTIPVTIVPATLQSLTLTKTNLTMRPGQAQTIQVYGNFVDSLDYVFALEMTNYVTWSSTDSAVSTASVGTVSAGSSGTANITASFSSQSVATSVTVSPSETLGATPKGVGLLGTYYSFTTGPWASNNIQDPFEVLFGSRIDSQVYFDWSTGINNLGQPLYFGIRWTGRIYIPTTGSYTFYTQSDDGVRLSIDGNLVVENWTLHASAENASAPIVLEGGTYVSVVMEYFENAGYSVAQLKWAGPSITKELIPQVNLFPQ